MSREMRQIGVQFLAKGLDKFPERISYIGDQGIAGTLHCQLEIIPRTPWDGGLGLRFPALAIIEPRGQTPNTCEWLVRERQFAAGGLESVQYLESGRSAAW